MWILLSILAFIILSILLILLLPITIIISTDKNGEIKFEVKLLFKTFSDEKASDSSFAVLFKKIFGTKKEETKKTEADKKNIGFLEKLNQKVSLIKNILKSIEKLPKSITVKKLKVKIICAESDAAQTAISYGRCYAIISPLLSYLHSFAKIRKKSENINITCNYEGQQPLYEFYIALSIRVYSIMGVLLRYLYNREKVNQ